MEDKYKFTKNDCGKKMTREESRKVQLGMLNALVQFCDEHGLRYFLSGGTLLGAIRHQGFIPWDDDIDVNMPRPDCEKLMELTKGKLDSYIVAGPDMDGFAMGCETYRIYDIDTIIENFIGGATKNHPSYHPIFIDVFPIEGLPKGEFATRMHYFEMVAIRKMQRSSGLEHMVGKSLAAHIFHIISRIPARIVGYKKWSIMAQKTAMKYDFDSHDYVGVMTATVHTVEEKVLKKEYLQTVDVLFEGQYYHAPGNYDTYLKQLYGDDYMQLPPLEKQQSHHAFDMYWRKQ